MAGILLFAILKEKIMRKHIMKAAVLGLLAGGAILGASFRHRHRIFAFFR